MNDMDFAPESPSVFGLHLHASSTIYNANGPSLFRQCDLPMNLAPSQCDSGNPLVQSNAQDDLHPLVDEETHSHHGHDFEIADPQPHPVAPPTSFSPDPPRSLRHIQPVSIAYHSSDLHSPSDDLQRVSSRLGDQAGHPTSQELGPVL